MSTEVTIPLTNRSSGRTTSVSVFTDDTIEVVRIKIGVELGIHHDRLRIYAMTELPGPYYNDDPRAWKSLFLRMSPDGKPLRDVSKASYQASRDVPFPFPDGEIDEARWTTEVPRAMEASFHELRLLGVPESHSWVFPLDNTTDPGVLPEVAEIARPANRMIFTSVHPYPVKGFVAVPFEDGGRPVLQDQYVPYLRPGTPAAVPDALRNTVVQQTDLIRALATLNVKAPSRSTLLRARWKIPLVETEFGESPRNRFEQMFFGLTLSPGTPYVGFYTSKTEQTRHKFYTEDTVNKKPILDLREWAHWWTVSKPSRNRPTVIVYRGKGRSHFDRIAISATDIIVVSHRPEGNTETIDELQADVLKWFKTLDAVMPFVDEQDLTRIELQTASAEFDFADPLTTASFLRFDCLRTIFDIYDKKSLSFRFLRANGSDLGLTPNEASAISMLREDIGTSPDDLADALSIPLGDAERLLLSVRSKLEEDESLLTKVSQSLPSFRFTAKSAVVVSADDVPRISSYIAILRHILMHDKEPKLDSVCPTRGEEVEPVAAIAEVFAPPPVPESEDLGDLLGDLLADIGGDEGLNVASVAPLAAPPPPAPAKKAKAKIKVEGDEETLYGYFSKRLKEFDPETFGSGKTGCDLARQPVVMTQDDLDREGTSSDYNPYNQNYEDAELMDTEDPNGVFLCPEYWCVIDKIPLRESDLVEGACPVCGGKVRDPKSKAKVADYPVLKRRDAGKGYQYPGELKEKAPNGKPIPCCFQKKQKTRVSKMIPLPPSRVELFYILGETKTDLPPMRFAYLYPKTIAALQVNTSYDVIKRDQNRIQAGRSGVFRVGIGRPRETLPQTLGVKTKVPDPAANPDDVLRCSFFRTWNHPADGAPANLMTKFAGNESLARMVYGIHKAWEAGELSMLNELEYCCIALDCDFFRVKVDDDGAVSVGCLFASGFLRNANRAIAVLFHPGSTDYLGFVSRTSASADPQVITNLFNPVFSPHLLETLSESRDKACWTAPLPSLRAVLDYTKQATSKSYVILDPYKRAQALFYPKKAIFPFQPESLVETQNFQTLDGYSSIGERDLPPKDTQVKLLEGIAKYHRGYEYKEDLTDQSGMVRELLLASGLRVPVLPFASEPRGRPLEVTETVRKGFERVLAFGQPNKDDATHAASIRYESEVFEFLLFELSNDLDDQPDLKEALLGKDKDALAKELATWMDRAIVFHSLQDPPAFVSKIRTPCSGRDKKDCGGTLCAWEGKSCKVNVRAFKRAPIEQRLLSTLLSNDKIRSIVLDGRASPFFSTVLYVEMPHELFLADGDLDEYKKVVRSE